MAPIDASHSPIPAEPDFAAPQREVQRKLGRCMFRLQQYEILAKALVSHREISAPSGKMHEVQAKNVALAASKTLGQLVGELTGTFLKPLQSEPENNSAESEDGFGEDQQAWFRFSNAIELPPERRQQLMQDLADLVKMRNELVHHFIERFDVFTIDGCLVADNYLQGCYETIEGHFLTLRAWVEGMNRARKAAAEFMQSPEFLDFFMNVDVPDVTGVDWPGSRIVKLLKGEEEVGAVEGWTLLNTAIASIREKEPEQTPKKYGCSSWREVIHKSQLFEIRKDKSGGEYGTLVWYRSKPMPVRE
jgi:hypothetical protein